MRSRARIWVARILRVIILVLHRLGARIAGIEAGLKGALPGLDEAVVQLPSGRWLKLNAGGDLGKSLFLDGILGYEGTTTRTWYEFCKRADLVLDIGANLGIFALLAADANPTAKVFAFEPVPANFGYLCAHVDSNGMCERITPLQMAVSDHGGTGELLLRGMSGSTLAQDFWADSAGLQRIHVKTVTLDDWLSTNSLVLTSRSVVKLDIETHEPAALRGACRALSQGPAIFCEVLATFTELELGELLPASQWKYFWIGPDGPVERRRIVGDPAWKYNNYLFLVHDSPYLSVVSR